MGENSERRDLAGLAGAPGVPGGPRVCERRGEAFARARSAGRGPSCSWVAAPLISAVHVDGDPRLGPWARCCCPPSPASGKHRVSERASERMGTPTIGATGGGERHGGARGAHRPSPPLPGCPPGHEGVPPPTAVPCPRTHKGRRTPCAGAGAAEPPPGRRPAGADPTVLPPASPVGGAAAAAPTAETGAVATGSRGVCAPPPPVGHRRHWPTRGSRGGVVSPPVGHLSGR